jgi:hypothetical protein
MTMRTRRLLGVLLLCCTGCASTGGFAFFAAPALPVVQHTEPCASVLKPTAENVAIEVASIRRGVRGGSFILAIQNKSKDQALMIDWSKLTLRLGNGQFRPPMTDEEFLKLGLEFGFRAYGWDDDAMRQKTPDVTYPVRGEFVRLKHGETLKLAVHFGAPEDEDTILASFDEAFAWEGLDFRRLGPVTPAVRCAIQLPCLNPPKTTSWWPDWLHVGVMLSNGN